MSKKCNTDSEWIDQHSDTFLMTTDVGFALSHRKNKRQYAQLK